MGDTSLQMYFIGGLSVFIALNALLCSEDDTLPQHWSVLRAIHTLHSCKNYICLFGELLPIHFMQLRGSQGLMWGTRGPLPLAAAMVGYDCVGRCWLLQADVRSIHCRNSRNCLRIFFSFLRRSHIFLTSDPAAK